MHPVCVAECPGGCASSAPSQHTRNLLPSPLVALLLLASQSHACSAGLQNIWQPYSITTRRYCVFDIFTYHTAKNWLVLAADNVGNMHPVCVAECPGGCTSSAPGSSACSCHKKPLLNDSCHLAFCSQRSAPPPAARCVWPDASQTPARCTQCLPCLNCCDSAAFA
jgi:hypothetical protein